MNSYIVDLPSTQAFSDTVIGHVVQRSSRRCDHEEDQKVYQPRTRHRHAPYQQTRRGYTMDTPESPTEGNREVSMEPELPSSIVGLIGMTLSSRRKRASCITSDLKTANEIIATNRHVPAELQQVIVADALEKKIRRRESIRIAQARFREKKKKAQNATRSAIAKLKSDIKYLESKSKDSLRIPIAPTKWALASEYFRQFNSYVASHGAFGPTASEFLHDMVDPDVLVGSQFGVEAALENWKLFPLCFEDVRTELKDMKMPTPDTLVASTVTSVCITNKTLRNAFPHLIDDSGRPSPLATRLLGEKLVMKGSVLFRWDSSTDKVVQLLSQTDMLTSMLNVLQSLEDISSVFCKSRITLH